MDGFIPWQNTTRALHLNGIEISCVKRMFNGTASENSEENEVIRQPSDNLGTDDLVVEFGHVGLT